MEYHKGIERISSSGLKMILRQSPAHFFHRYGLGIEQEQTTALLMGQLVHALVLEGDEAARARYGVAPANPGTKKYADWLEESRGLVGGLKGDDWDEAYAIRDAVLSDPVIAGLLSAKGVTEQAIEWVDPITGAACKAKPDWLAADASLCIDLKTSSNASFPSFANTVRFYDYDLSASFYLDGIEATAKTTPEWLWVVVEKAPPYATAVYAVSSETLDEGSRKASQALATYAACMKTRSWPGYPRQVI